MAFHFWNSFVFTQPGPPYWAVLSSSSIWGAPAMLWLKASVGHRWLNVEGTAEIPYFGGVLIACRVFIASIFSATTSDNGRENIFKGLFSMGRLNYIWKFQLLQCIPVQPTCDVIRWEKTATPLTWVKLAKSGRNALRWAFLYWTDGFWNFEPRNVLWEAPQNNERCCRGIFPFEFGY